MTKQWWPKTDPGCCGRAVLVRTLRVISTEWITSVSETRRSPPEHHVCVRAVVGILKPVEHSGRERVLLQKKLGEWMRNWAGKYEPNHPQVT